MSTFDFGNLIGRDQIALVYVAYYGRLPDPEGFDFWEKFFLEQTGTGRTAASTVLEITDFFLDQDETRSNYSFFDDPASASVEEIGTFLDQVYFNLFNRPPDDAGKAFWSGQIANRLEANEGFSDLLTQIIEGAQADDISAMDNKLAVGKHYVENIGEQFDLTQATRIALDTTADDATATTNIAAIDALVAGETLIFDAGRSDTYFLVSDEIGGEIALVDTANRTAQVVANTGVDAITDIAVSPTGDLLVSTASTLYSYSFASGALTEVLDFPTSVNALGTDANGTLYAAGPDVPTLYQIDTSTGAIESIGNLPGPAAGDITATLAGVTVSQLNDDLTFVSTGLTDEVVTLQSNPEISTFEALIQLGDETLAGAGTDITNITNDARYTALLTINDPAFDEISGATYMYDSLAEYLLA